MEVYQSRCALLLFDSLRSSLFHINILTIDGYVCWDSNRLLLFIVCLPRKTNSHFSFPFVANKWKLSISIFCLQQTNWNCHFLLVLYAAVLIYLCMQCLALFNPKRINPSNVCDCNRLLLPILRRKLDQALCDVYWLAGWLLYWGSKYLEHISSSRTKMTLSSLILNNRMKQNNKNRTNLK
jgi:hypothetical protein